MTDAHVSQTHVHRMSLITALEGQHHSHPHFNEGEVQEEVGGHSSVCKARKSGARVRSCIAWQHVLITQRVPPGVCSPWSWQLSTSVPPNPDTQLPSCFAALQTPGCVPKPSLSPASAPPQFTPPQAAGFINMPGTWCFFILFFSELL